MRINNKSQKKILLVIDVQKGFLNEHTKHLPGKISDFIKKHSEITPFFFKFKNNESSPWKKFLNWNEMMWSEDVELVDELDLFANSKNTFTKEAMYSVFGLKDFMQQHLSPENEIYICGMDTDACILVSLMHGFEKGYNLYCIEDLCASTGGDEYHDAAIKLMRRNLGKARIIQLSEIKN